MRQVYVAPGNGGTAWAAAPGRAPSQNVALDATDLPGLLAFARQEAIDLTLVGPEAPLVAGLVVLVYTWFLGGRPGTAAREVLAWTQVVLILVFVYGGQAIFRDSANRLEMAAYHVPWWVVYTPPGWLAPPAA